MFAYPLIPEYGNLPRLSYRSRIAFRILQREKGFAIPDEDNAFLNWMIHEIGIQPLDFYSPAGEDWTPAERFVYQGVFTLFRERMSENLPYGFFFKCLIAATESHFSGPATYAGFGIYAPFYQACAAFGKTAEPRRGLPWDRYSFHVTEFFMKGLSPRLVKMPYRQSWPPEARF